MKLSVVIITFNEGRNIERCIRSLLPVADEIIVVDSFSTDRTAEICSGFQVQFVQQKWLGYSAQKNFANALSEHEYILSIDADEALDETLQGAILELKTGECSGVYSVNRLTNYCGKWIHHSGWYPDVKVRLFPKKKVRWIGEFVHEELDIPEDLKTEQLPGHLLHYSYYNFKEHRERADKYSALTAQKMHASGKKANFLKPWFSGIARFFSMYFIKTGFLDGKMGWKIAVISAASNVFKYKELRRLNKSGSNKS